jgi:hypothetical protein
MNNKVQKYDLIKDLKNHISKDLETVYQRYFESKCIINVYEDTIREDNCYARHDMYFYALNQFWEIGFEYPWSDQGLSKRYVSKHEENKVELYEFLNCNYMFFHIDTVLKRIYNGEKLIFKYIDGGGIYRIFWFDGEYCSSAGVDVFKHNTFKLFLDFICLILYQQMEKKFIKFHMEKNKPDDKIKPFKAILIKKHFLNAETNLGTLRGINKMFDSYMFLKNGK